MAEGTKELHFEDHITQYLTHKVNPSFPEYRLGKPEEYDKELCMIKEDLIGFIRDTQPDTYRSLEEQYGSAVDHQICQRAAISLEKGKNKTLDFFHKNLRIGGQNLKTIFFQPVHSNTPEHQLAYENNRLTIVRQLKYSRQNENSIDIVLFINGMPVVTIELKNALTGQYLHHAIRQYMQDRDPKEALFEFKRCLVHFAVSTEQVSMCTRLEGKKTRFLPFNKALVNEDSSGFAVSYLWEEILRKDSLMDLVQNFVNAQVVEEYQPDPVTGQIKKKETEILIFPRYHQLRAVRRLLKAVKEDGTGKKYLIKHSAGSGKSNTISWLAHRLAGLYRNQNDERVLFNSVLVVTDRKVLDKQIQNNIAQFEQQAGVVEYIDERKTSQDLKKAIKLGRRIIVTTLQKFPVISEEVGRYPNRTYAVIIDEAHSSQAGESARHLRKALSLEEAESEDKVEKELDEIIEDEIRRKGDQSNISFFAFTATPKNKTIEMFGTDGPGGKAEFDLYSMEQAIKEGFIKDVLKNYMSWKRYYKLVKRSESFDKEYEKKKAVKLLASYVDLQDHAIEKKARVMIEHFVSQTQYEIQGKARAMLVTRSRLHAVRFKRKFDDIMREMKLPYGALVAFSGKVDDPETGESYTKEIMNQLGGNMDIPMAFRMPKFRILIVANMYQTGFDEPWLHTMFVDKKLGGASTVQTLSRLNRTCSGKDSTMVLDFVNNPEQIQEDFQEYYGSNYIDKEDLTDENSVYDLLSKIESFHLINKEDLEEYAEIFFKSGDNKELLQPILGRLVSRFEKQLTEEKQFEFKKLARNYVRFYRFISQIIRFADAHLEKYYVLLTDLQKRLPSAPGTQPLDVLEETELESYKLQHQFTSNLNLESGDSGMKGLEPGGAGQKEEEEMEWLSRIIKILNDTFGLELSEEDKLEVKKVQQNIYDNDELMGFFNPNNSKENIRDKFDEEVDFELLNFINTKLDLYNRLSEKRVNRMLKQAWFNEVYDRRLRGM
jgi:type I restriction enzyme R subunit